MKKNFLLLLLLGSFSLLQTNAQTFQSEQAAVSIVPKPETLVRNPGTFLLSSRSAIHVPSGRADSRKVAEMLAAQLQFKTGLQLRVVSGATPPTPGAIILTTRQASDSLGKEGYHLSVQRSQVTITAQTSNGHFYGMHTLLQLISPKPQPKQAASITIPAVTIIDKPRFSWRGAMLDVGRYYYSIDFLKKFIDYMALHKLNTFHWHLTEDHGWRLEIKKYPLLTQIGAWRSGTQFDRTQVNNTPHGGYYTQEQVKELVAYAQDRYITIVPEIEMPGHSLAALVAYPELSCTGGPFQMPVKWAIQKDVYCAGNEKTFEFLQNILTEVTELFPSPIIHIGGDECPKDRWKACPKCQARLKAEGLKDEHELQSYFIRRIEKFLLTKNRNIIGWDEILEGGLAPNAAVMSWRGTKGGIEAAKQHHPVVMTPSDYYYLDYYQGMPYLEPIAIGNGGVTSLKKVYSYEPVAPELAPEEAKFIIGVQGNVWSEFIHSPDKVEYMLYPRAAAVAETGWTPAHLKNWEDFTRRMENLYHTYELMGINYARSAYQVHHSIVMDSVRKTATISLSTNSFKPVIRYTVDGSEPTLKSTLYTRPFILGMPRTVKAASFRNNERVGGISEFAVIARAVPVP